MGDDPLQMTIGCGSLGCMQDEEVVDLARSGHSDATEFLISRYRPLVETKARAYYVVGADREDVIQEGMIGLCKAIRDFRIDRLAKFRPFAELCVTRQIITAVKTATRQKHVPLNGYVSLNQQPGASRGASALEELLPDARRADPERLILEAGLPRRLCEGADGGLSPLEMDVLKGYMEGLSYREMSIRIGCPTKSIDNALQRAKRKIGAIILDSRESEHSA